uniref:Uncharacterized protein n=1 Tax=Janibacter limosus TaxID=53458 RepID=A0AC61U4Y0_9MICO|nr:hypothetical protein [Janibacter limosus]
MKHLRETAPRFEDWEGLQEALADAYFPHAMHPSSSPREAAASGPEVIDLGSCRLAHIRFGATVGIESDHPGAVAVNIPLSGHLASRIGSLDFDAGPGQATAFPADTPARMPAWTPDADVLGLRIDAEHLRRESERVFARKDVVLPDRDRPAHAGRPGPVPDGPHDLRQRSRLRRDPLPGPAGRRVDREHARHRPAPRGRPRRAARPERTAATAGPPGHRGHRARPRASPVTGGSRRHRGGERSSAAAVLPRARGHHPLRPPARRAARAHPRRPRPRTGRDGHRRRPVVGVTHPGRFAAAYRDKYGELPSHTLATAS